MATAEDLTALTRPWDVARVTMDGTAGNSRAVKLPSWARSFSVTFRQAAGAADTGQLERNGTDAAAIGNNAYPVASGANVSVALFPGRQRDPDSLTVYLAGGTNTGFAYLSVHESELG